MGRGPGKNNMSVAELKAAKAKRDARFYEKNRDEVKEKYYLAKKNAATIMCSCGGRYKDIPQLKNTHFSTQQHSLWDEEEKLCVRELMCKKIQGINTTEEAQAKLDDMYFDAKRFNYAQKEGHLPKLMRSLNKLEDKPIKKKLVIKRKINVIKEE